MSFTPLRVRSHGSLLHGVASPEALIERALALGYRALALTDRDNLYLGVRFYQRARAEGLTPLLGAELVSATGSALLLTLDRRGYGNLGRLLTDRHLDAGFDLVAALGRHAAGLHIIVESAGLAASLLAAGVRPAAGELPGRSPEASRSAPGGLWLGIRGIARERVRLGERLAAARRLGVPPVATGDVLLLAAGDHATHRAVVTAAAGELLERMPPSSFEAEDAVLAAPAEWARRVQAVCRAAGAPEAARAALTNNRALVERCRLELELGTPIFPHAPLPEGETGAGYLLRLGRAGVTRRYARGAARPLRREALRRLRWELGLIERLGFTDYFLLVADIVQFARGRSIPTVGRGSGAGSIVAYCLGITNVDPIRHGLYFERFLHPARRDCPDLDIDLCWQRRDEVIAHVYETYGEERVAMISTHATLGARSAFRETAKALGVPHARVNQLARRIPRSLEQPYAAQLRALPEPRAVDWREPALAQALALAERLEGAPRHLSIHSGGVVIGDQPLPWYVPLERAAKGIVVTQFEMRAIEAIGLVKMDLLGNRALTTIGQCVSLAAERGVSINVDELPDPDPATARRLSAGDTLNCFQLESPAMRHLVRMLSARTLEDTTAAVALVRPGPAESGMKEAFCRRRRGIEPTAYPHPRLEATLRSTHGVLLYEEDVMRVAAALANIPLHEGDELRRAIGGARTDAERAALEEGFVRCATRAGVEQASARTVWRELARFGGYAFCKAHAAGYGALGYQSVYLKTHVPAEYAASILNHHAGMYETWVHVDDLRRQNVVFRPPCVRASAWETTLEVCPAAADTGGRAVRIGLARVHGLAVATGDRILAARSARRFGSLADLVDRVRPTPPELEALILAGALDWTERSRPALLLEARAGEGAWRRSPPRRASALALVTSDGTALAIAEAPVAVPELPEFDAAERVRGEFRSTGLWFSAHPLDVWVDAAAERGVTTAAELPARVGERVAVVGLPSARRGVTTKKGQPMLFLTLADRSGLAECVLFPDAYRRWASAARGAIVRVEGRVDETLDAVTVTADGVTTLV